MRRGENYAGCTAEVSPDGGAARAFHFLLACSARSGFQYPFLVQVLFSPENHAHSPCHLRVPSLFSDLPSMQKTKKSVAKRFKISGTGKLIRRTPGFRHLLSAKSTKSKRRASRDKLVAPGHAKPLLRALPFGL